MFRTRMFNRAVVAIIALAASGAQAAEPSFVPGIGDRLILDDPPPARDFRQINLLRHAQDAAERCDSAQFERYARQIRADVAIRDYLLSLRQKIEELCGKQVADGLTFADVFEARHADKVFGLARRAKTASEYDEQLDIARKKVEELDRKAAASRDAAKQARSEGRLDDSYNIDHNSRTYASDAVTWSLVVERTSNKLRKAAFRRRAFKRTTRRVMYHPHSRPALPPDRPHPAPRHPVSPLATVRS